MYRKELTEFVIGQLIAMTSPEPSRLSVTIVHVRVHWTDYASLSSVVWLARMGLFNDRVLRERGSSFIAMVVGTPIGCAVCVGVP